MNKSVSGFSKLEKEEKIEWLNQNFLGESSETASILRRYWNKDHKIQKLHDEFTENTLSNYYLPFGIAPNFLINDTWYAVPMAIEESSVIAAASKAAKFWSERGGIKAEVKGTKKTGQVHFIFKGKTEDLQTFFRERKNQFLEAVTELTANMKKRGGGILDLELLDKTHLLPNYFQLHATFETRDSMGANFINSCLEKFAEALKTEAQNYPDFSSKEQQPEIIMSILSNYVPECVVKAEVTCSVEELSDNGISGAEFAEKFIIALKMAEVEPHRAVTHNKGIMNGIDAVVLATGNDFRAVEAGIHAFASKTGNYTSLSHAKIEGEKFTFWLEIPLALGTVGGLTSLHPLSKVALEILQKPSAPELMKIVAAAGLAQNFAAVKSLITTGIQKGHMKMHLKNILNQLHATDAEKEELISFFSTRLVTHKAVEKELEQRRKSSNEVI